MPGSDARRRFIIFDGPAYDAVRLTDKSPEWHWERFDFSHDELVELERRPSPFLSTLEQAQADEQDAFMDAEDDHGQLDANDLASSEDLSGDAVADADTAPVRSVIPQPSTIPRPSLSQRQLLSQSMVQPSQRPVDRSLLHNTLDRTDGTAFLDSQASSLGDESLGPPPLFIWELSSLTTFDRFRDVLAHHSTLRKAAKPTVSFLAAIIDLQAARFMGTSGKQKAEWHLMDPTGQQVTLGIWGAGADDVCSLVRRGDIVFVGDAKLGTWKDRLELSVNHDGSSALKGWRLQIVWRSHISCDEDYDHRVNPALREVRHHPGFARVDRVLEIVDWYDKVMLQRRR